MEQAQLVPSEATTPTHYRLEVESAKYVISSYVPNTLRTRLSQLRTLEQYATARGYSWCAVSTEPFPVKLLEVHLRELFESGASLKTIDARIDAARWWSVERGFVPPTTHPVLVKMRKGFSMTRAKENQAGKNKVEVAHAIPKRVLLEVVANIPDTLKGKRDKALLLLGWCGAFRRSELATLVVENVEAFDNTESGVSGIECKVFNTKTNKNGSVDKSIPKMSNPRLCPVRAYYAWLKASGVTEGNVFRAVSKGGVVGASLSCHSVNAIVKAYFPELPTEGKQPTELRKRSKVTAHSLRAGYATASVIDKIPPSEARAQGGWSDKSGIFDTYATRAELGMVARVATW